jgi:hypothetical protein
MPAAPGPAPRAGTSAEPLARTGRIVDAAGSHPDTPESARFCDDLKTAYARVLRAQGRCVSASVRQPRTAGTTARSVE